MLTQKVFSFLLLFSLFKSRHLCDDVGSCVWEKCIAGVTDLLLCLDTLRAFILTFHFLFSSLGMEKRVLRASVWSRLSALFFIFRS